MSLGRSQPWAGRDLGGGRSLAPACRQGGLKGDGASCSDNLDHWIMDEWHISVKENWETKLIVLVAAPWGTGEIRLFALLASPACRWVQSSGHLQPEFPLRPLIPSTPSSFP